MEDGGVGFSRAGIGRGNNEIKVPGESETLEDGVESAVEIRDDGEFQPGLAGAIEELRDFREKGPCGGVGVVVEEGIEGHAGDLLAEGVVDEVAPPAAFDFVAVLGSGEIGRWEAAEGAAEGLGHFLRGGLNPVLAEDAGVNRADGFSEIDEGPGGIEKKGADHGWMMSAAGR